MERTMKITIRIACTVGAFAIIASAALAQSTSASISASTTESSPTTAPQTPEQREAAQKEAMKKALDARQAAAEQAKRDLEQAQKHLSQEPKLTEQERARIQEALQKVQQELALYSMGTAALDQARYEKALQAFAEAAALKGAKADGALYWKAFAEYKVAALQAALQSLKQMQKEFPDSRWLEQARALEFEVQRATGNPVSPAATPDEELKLLALDSLLHTDSEQALPMLEKMINGQQPPHLKKRALFVLSQSKSPRAREILTSVAKGSPDPDLQLEALQYLQIFGGAEDKKLLSDIYTVSKDRDVKGRLIDTLFMDGDAKALVALARKETDPEMRKRIVERLSHMKSKDATDFMLELINK
jgi:hypothetical protein